MSAVEVIVRLTLSSDLFRTRLAFPKQLNFDVEAHDATQNETVTVHLRLSCAFDEVFPAQNALFAKKTVLFSTLSGAVLSARVPVASVSLSDQNDLTTFTLASGQVGVPVQGLRRDTNERNADPQTWPLVKRDPRGIPLRLNWAAESIGSAGAGVPQGAVFQYPCCTRPNRGPDWTVPACTVDQGYRACFQGIARNVRDFACPNANKPCGRSFTYIS